MNDQGAYYNNTTLKYELMFEISEHERLDHYRRGIYFDPEIMKGCAIGCLTNDLGGEHHSLSKVYNIPEDTLYLCDSIFEGLPLEDSKKWSARFFGVITPGQDLTDVWSKFIHWMLVDPEYGVINVTGNTHIQSLIKHTAQCLIDGIPLDVRQYDFVNKCSDGRSSPTPLGTLMAVLYKVESIPLGIVPSHRMNKLPDLHRMVLAEESLHVGYSRILTSRAQSDKLVEIIRS